MGYDAYTHICESNTEMSVIKHTNNGPQFATIKARNCKDIDGSYVRITVRIERDKTTVFDFRVDHTNFKKFYQLVMADAGLLES